TERDAKRFHAVVLGGVHDQRTPSTTDVQHLHSRLQAKLTAEIVALFLLSGDNVLVFPLEIRAGVKHPRVEPQGIKVVAYVVMVLNRLGSAVPPAGTKARQATRKPVLLELLRSSARI